MLLVIGKSRALYNVNIPFVWAINSNEGDIKLEEKVKSASGNRNRIYLFLNIK